ncbi:M24 family metallopeptidase [Puniceibacterium sediminis]|uniref:Xaa-Pro aminopeptidase n=1 Tax=Puniceibacterium sediminis TaxID=1608407 RepID=A0A238WZS6_9RHOB|nr:Xaa-Pro peptidase family protein [Puniceibacterium sediminis]SNR51933.1 Xaa-Pro aminopeptidase [Puniceibacterium sediminis]
MSLSLPASEFRNRVARAQTRMAGLDLGALLVTSEADLRYFSGFLTRFWESPSRPWFLIVPASGDPVAVIPAIGEALMQRTWVRDIRCWPAPRPSDDGISMLADTLSELAPGGRIGMPMGPGTQLRMPLADYFTLRSVLGGMSIVPDQGLVQDLRAVKSPAEIALIRQACAIGGRAFDRVPQIAAAGVGLDRVFRDFQRLCLEEGADWVPYLAGASDQGGYADVISPATSAPLRAGDVLMLDTGLVHEGYFCDFDRNYSVGQPSQEVRDAHARLIDATAAGFSAARAGAKACDLHAAMSAVPGARTAPGRLGHGLGMQLTEGFSILPDDISEMQVGMVLTLEPCIAMTDGRIMVHEENIVIGSDGPDWLSPPAGPDIPILEGIL